MIQWLLALLKSGWTAEDFIPSFSPRSKCSSKSSGDDDNDKEMEDSSEESMSGEESTDESNEFSEGESESNSEKNLPMKNSLKVFYKKFKRDQIDLWIRLRTEASKFHSMTVPVDAWCVGGEVVRGEIDLLQDTRGYSRRFCTWVNALWVYDSFSDCLRCNEFFHEALLSYFVRTSLADLPMFSRAALVYANVSKRTLGFKKVQGGLDMDKELYKMNCAQLHSCIAQVLVGLRIAQFRMKLKHHDLHLGNVMVSPRPESSVLVLDTPEGSLKIPLVGYDATIIDFGLSSMSEEKALVRLDIDLLIQGGSEGSRSTSRLTSDIGKSWGTWDPDLSGDTGYDFSMFIESVTETVLEERPLDLQKITLLAKLQELITTKFTDRCRPQDPSLADWPKVWKVLELNP